MRWMLTRMLRNLFRRIKVKRPRELVRGVLREKAGERDRWEDVANTIVQVYTRHSMQDTSLRSMLLAQCVIPKHDSAKPREFPIHWVTRIVVRLGRLVVLYRNCPDLEGPFTYAVTPLLCLLHGDKSIQALEIFADLTSDFCPATRCTDPCSIVT